MGIPFWNPGYDELRAWWENTLCATERKAQILCLANPNTLNIAWGNPDFYKALREMEVCVNDGVGIRIASLMRGVRMRYNFAGTDLMPKLFAELPEEYTAFFYGAEERVNELAVQRVSEQFEKLKIVGRVNGYVDPETEALPAIQRAGADILMVALGQPKQELFMMRHKDLLGAKIAVTCGGMFDFFSGVKPRAPLWMRKAGFEWLFRLCLEPRRLFPRYGIGNPAFLARAIATLGSDKALARANQANRAATS